MLLLCLRLTSNVEFLTLQLNKHNQIYTYVGNVNKYYLKIRILEKYISVCQPCAHFYGN